MPDPSRFWDKLARRYAAQPIADQASYERKLAETRTFIRPDSEVLEFGCGTGTTALTHAPYAGHIHGIDFSKAMIDICREKASAAGVSNVTFTQGTLDDIPDEPRYDIVMGMSILHLLSDWQGTIKKAFGLLKPGGAFITSTVCIGGRYWAMRMILPLPRKLGLLPDIQFITAEQLKSEMQRAGFTLDRDWRPTPKASIFIVAIKPKA